MRSLCVKIFLVIALLIGFTYSTAYAQADFSVWNESLWKIKQTAKGVTFSHPEDNDPPDGKARSTDQMWGVMFSDATGENISMQIYERDRNGDCGTGDLLIFTKQYGAPEGFVATVEMDATDPRMSMRGLFYFTGKVKNSEVRTGKMTSLGGYSIQSNWDNSVVEGDIATFGLTTLGTLLKEPKGCLLER